MIINKEHSNKTGLLNILYREFNIKNKPTQGIQDIKNNLLRLIIYILNIMGIPVVVMAIIMAIQLDNYFIAARYFVFFIPVPLAFILMKKAHYKLSAFLIILAAYLTATGDLYTFGYYGMSIPIYLTIFVITVIFFNLKGGLIAILFSIIPYIIVGYLFINENLVFDFYQLIKIPISWVAAVFLLVFLGSIIVISFGFILHKMDEKIAFSELQTLKLAKDIKDIKKAEKAQKESEEKFRVIVESVNDWIWETDKNGIFTYSSPKIESILGYTAQEMIGKQPYDFMPNMERERVSKLFKEKVRNNESINKVENINIHKNGHPVVLETSGTPYFDANNKLLGYRGVDREITDIKNGQVALIKSEEQLRESNKTKDKFFSIIAHDLRSPFNTMLGFSNLLVDKFDEYSTEEQKKFINILNEDIQSTYNLLENLLFWSRAQSDTIDFKPEKENLYLLSVETIRLLNQSAKNKSISIINNINESIFVKADKNMLLTILRNLISNAIKFTAQNGEIYLNSLLFTDENNKDLVQVSVQDSGIGIDEDKLDKLFSISENITTKGTEKESGTGLGLIICKEFIEKQGGSIRVESLKGKGSKFIFTLLQDI